MTENPSIQFIVVLVLAMLMLLWGTTTPQTKVFSQILFSINQFTWFVPKLANYELRITN